METHLGLAQDRVLSPELFIVYLHEVIQSRQLLKDLVKESNLQTFADDIICDLWGENRTKQAINEFLPLDQEWNLKLTARNVRS